MNDLLNSFNESSIGTVCFHLYIKIIKDQINFSILNMLYCLLLETAVAFIESTKGTVKY